MSQGRKDEASERPVSRQFGTTSSSRRKGAVLRKLLSFIASAAPRKNGTNLRACAIHSAHVAIEAWLGVHYLEQFLQTFLRSSYEEDVVVGQGSAVCRRSRVNSSKVGHHVLRSKEEEENEEYCTS